MNNKIYESHIKHLNQKMGWVYGPSPMDGEWYWCAMADGTTFVAVATRGMASGWANNDTWEDFDKAVIAYKKLQKPLFKV